MISLSARRKHNGYCIVSRHAPCQLHIWDASYVGCSLDESSIHQLLLFLGVKENNAQKGVQLQTLPLPSPLAPLPPTQKKAKESKRKQETRFLCLLKFRRALRRYKRHFERSKPLWSSSWKVQLKSALESWLLSSLKGPPIFLLLECNTRPIPDRSPRSLSSGLAHTSPYPLVD